MFILTMKGTKCKEFLNLVKSNLVHFTVHKYMVFNFSFFFSRKDYPALLDIRNLSK